MTENRFSAAVARDYDAGRTLPEGVLKTIHLRIAAATGTGPESTVLDVGAGTGALVGPVLRSGCRYAGVDASRPMLKRFRAAAVERVASSGRPPGLVQGDLLALPFRSETFDAVLAFRVFGVVPGWRHGVRECLRVLRPGGHLVAGRVVHSPDSLHAFVRAERNRLLRELGIDSRRPGADDDTVQAALRAEAVAGEELEPVTWTTRTTPQQQIERNLSGWRVQSLTADTREWLRAEMAVATAARHGDMDSTIEERAAFVLNSFRKQ